MIPILEITKLALRSLFRNKTRSLLTMLGIIIGVSAVILLVSIGQGLQNYLLSTFESLGSNLVTVLPGKVGQGGFSAASSPNFAGTKLTVRDVNDISHLGGAVESAGGGLQSAATVSNGGKSKFVEVVGVDSTYLRIRDLTVENGRTISDSDARVSRNVAIVGKSIVTDLYGGANPIGKKITVGSQKFEVIGVLKQIGSGGFGVDVNSYVVLPLTTAQKVFGISGVQVIAAKAIDKESIPAAIKQIKGLLGKRLKSDEFSVVDNSSLV